MGFCLHEWKRIEEPKFVYWNIDLGMQVLGAMCKCQKCGKRKMRKFEGYMVGSLIR